MWIKSGKCRRIFLQKACDGQSLIHLSPLIHATSLWSVRFLFNLFNLKYSRSRYPTLPTIAVDAWPPFSSGMILDNLKSVTFACSFSSNKMLEVLTSLWIIGSLQPLCKYSNAYAVSTTIRSLWSQLKTAVFVVDKYSCTFPLVIYSYTSPKCCLSLQYPMRGTKFLWWIFVINWACSDVNW